jgi:autoinducer 2 (AI-2) kinase
MGLDIGGSQGRCVVCDVDGGRMASAARPWRHRAAPVAWGIDLDAEETYRLLAEAAREAVAKIGAEPREILAVATTGMRHGSVVLDARDRVLLATPTRDARGAMQGLLLACDRGAEILERTGHFPAPLFTAARLLWMRDNARDAFDRADTVLGLAEWLAFRLSGRRVAEPSSSSETQLFAASAARWDDALIESLALPRRLFPAVATAGTVLGNPSSEVARAFGLSTDTLVVVGGGDTQCALLGAGVVDDGQLAIVAGTTMPIQRVSARPVLDPAGRVWTSHHAVPGKFVVEANAGASGEMLDWIAGMLYPDIAGPARALALDASLSPPGAEGIISTLGADIFAANRLRLPVGHLTIAPMTLAGASAPERRRHVARAVLEGMAYAARANVELLEEITESKARRLHVTGGMSATSTFAEIVRDVSGRDVVVPAAPEASAFGAAICAGVGAGVFADLARGASALARVRTSLAADQTRRAAYESLYRDWRELRQARTAADEIAERHAVSALTAKAAAQPPAPAASPRPRIFVTAALDERGLASLREIGEVTYASFRDDMTLLVGDELVDALRGFQVFVTEIDPVDADVLAKLPDLRVVASCRGKPVNVDVEACTAHGIPVLDAPARNADAVADLAVAFILMLARKLPAATDFLRQPGEAGDVGRMGRAFASLQGRELGDKTVGIIGFGAVGERVAKRLGPFGVKVLACDPFLRPDRAAVLGAEGTTLDALLAESDFVTLHASTEGDAPLLRDAELAKMKRGSFLVNTARAALVDESALEHALASGHLGGAALDVFSVEPPAPDHPLLRLPNVIATPHVGGNAREVSGHQGAIVAADLARLLRRERPKNLANPETLTGFGWDTPRPTPSRETLARLRAKAGPSVTDLEAAVAAKPPADRAVATTERPADESAVRAHLERVLTRFGERACRDQRFVAFSSGRSLVARYDLVDIGTVFHMSFEDGVVRFGLGAPPRQAQVTLKMKAALLDDLFSGRASGPKAALSGRLTFTGDTVKAMSMQRIQKDIQRLYTAACSEVRDADAASGRTVARVVRAPRAGVTAPAAERPPTDARAEVVRIVEELFAAGLVTGTGGNVSVRIAGADQAWITPSALFKGRLEPEMLVRIDFEGSPLDESPYAPSSERLIHAAIYRGNAAVGAVVHAHAPAATTLALAGLPFSPISTEAAMIGEIPRVPFMMPGTPDLARAVASALEGATAALLQNHGLVVAGADLRRAADLTAIVEATSQKILACRAVGRTPPVLPPDLVSELRSLGELLV